MTPEERARMVDRVQALSGRERQVVSLLADGLSPKQIAAALGTLSANTIRTYTKRARLKLRADSTPQVVAAFLMSPDRDKTNSGLAR